VRSVRPDNREAVVGLSIQPNRTAPQATAAPDESAIQTGTVPGRTGAPVHGPGRGSLGADDFAMACQQGPA
jgi:hypothetical protein